MDARAGKHVYFWLNVFLEKGTDVLEKMSVHLVVPPVWGVLDKLSDSSSSDLTRKSSNYFFGPEVIWFQSLETKARHLNP